MSADRVEGGCLCGAVRYAAALPQDNAWCHCRSCQKNSGSPAMAFGTVPAGDFALVKGEEHVASFASSPAANRHFCQRCGTPLFVRDHREPDMVYVSLATLDHPASAPPGFHIFYADRIAWAAAGDDLPRYDAFRRPPTGS